MSCEMEDALDAFFEGWPESRTVFDTLRTAVETLEEVELRVTQSQVAFRRTKPFAWAWVPGKVLHRKAAPLVLTLSFRSRDPSERWKEIVEPYSGRFTHHLELYASEEIDEQVRGWLRRAWDQAVQAHGIV